MTPSSLEFSSESCRPPCGIISPSPTMRPRRPCPPMRTSSGSPGAATQPSATSPTPAYPPLPVKMSLAKAAAVLRTAVRPTAAGAVPARLPVPTTVFRIPPFSAITTVGLGREPTSVRHPVPGRKTRPPPWATQRPRRPSLPPGQQNKSKVSHFAKPVFRSATVRCRWENNSVMGIHQKSFEFRAPDLSLHIHPGCRLKTNPRR
jgi:hypothetical protein